MAAFRLPVRQWTAWALSFVAGLVTALGHPPFSWPILSLLGLGCAAWLLGTRTNWRDAAFVGWWLAIGYFGLTLHWLVEPFLVFRESVWLAPIVAGLMIFGLSLFWTLAFALAWVVGAGRLEKCLSLAVFLTLAGILREYLFTGFPWALPGYVWSESPVGQICSAVGPHGLSFLTLLIAVLPAGSVRSPRGWSLSLLLLAALAVFGHLRQAPLPDDTTDRPVARLVQPNIPQDQKWLPERTTEFLRRKLSLSAAPSDRRPDQIIWPETAITFAAYERADQFEWLSEPVGNIPMIIGAPSRRDDKPYNSMLIMDDAGIVTGVYDKRHLVPFGEYVPFYDLLSVFGISAVARIEHSGFSPGSEGGQEYASSLGSIMPIICYEAVFPHEIRQRERPDVIVQITNDAWFGNFAGPQQHFAQSRMRSIELGLPLLRVANTGISGVTDGYGRVLSSLEVGESGYIDVPVPAALSPTPYARLGEIPVVVILAVLALVLLIRRRSVRV